MKQNTKLYFVITIIAVAGIALDLITKNLASGVTMPLISGVISILFTWNTGAGFSIFANHALFLTVFTGILIAGIVALIVFYKPKHPLFAVGIALVLSGAVGNFIDRVVFGAVRDFFCLEFISFPIFNVADVLLTVGAVLVCIWLVFFSGKKEKQKNGN